MLVSFVPTMVRWFGIGSAENVFISNVESVNGKFHIIYTFKNPLGFIKMFILTLIENADTYLGQILGYRTAWSNQTISLTVMIPFLVLLILSAVKMNEDKFEVTAKGRLAVFLMLLIELVGMHAIFLAETSVYSTVITGFQGRYLILLLPCVLLLLRNNGLVFREKAEYLYPCFSMAQMIYLYFFMEIFMCA